MIEEAKQRDSSHCMLAEAVRAALPGARFVGIDMQTMRFTDPIRPLRYVYLTPRVAQEALIAFDAGDELIPAFKCELRGGQVLATASLRKAPVDSLGQTREVRDAMRQAPYLLPLFPEAPKKKVARRPRARLKPVNGASGGNVPMIFSGRPAPISSFSKRREYGLRMLRK